MSPPISEQRQEIERKLAAHDGQRKLIEAELLALQHICPHNSARQWHDGGWGRMASDEWHCDDCGLHKSR